MSSGADTPSVDDSTLLRKYVEERSEAAFTEFVRRHLVLVYSAALRQLSGDTHRAKDICQAVFIAAARQARALRHHAALSGWLYTTTHHLVQRQLRTEKRRTDREREAHTMHELDRSGEADWRTLRPILDEAMQDLRESERLAVLLRFFEGQNLRAVGAALGISEDAARMRVDRALDRLRVMLGQRGITTTAAALAPALGAFAVEVAPAGLAGQVAAGVAATAGVAAATATGAGAVSTTSSSAIWAAVHTPIALVKTPLITTSLAAALVTVPLIWQHSQLSGAREELGRLQAQVQSLNDRPMNDERFAAARATADELTQLRAEAAELQALRAEKAALLAALRDPLQTQLDQVEEARKTARATLQQANVRVAFTKQREQLINAMKQIGLAARMHANDHQDKLPTTFEEFVEQLKDLRIDGELVNLELFEFFPQPRPINESEPNLFLFRERQPRPRPGGGWERAYTMVDGSVQTLSSETPDFTEAEKKTRGIAAPNQ